MEFKRQVLVALCAWALVVAAIAIPLEEKEVNSSNPYADMSPDLLELKAAKYLEEVEVILSGACYKNSEASWAYTSNVTDENLKAQTQAGLEYAKIKKGVWEKIVKFPWKNFTNPDLKRQFKAHAVLGDSALSPEKYEELLNVVSEMEGIYAKARVCDYKNASKCDLSLEPELTEILSESQDYDELAYVWKQWREVSGNKMIGMYPKYVELTNEAARINGFADGQEYWLDNFESETFVDDINKLWTQMRPFYDQLHAFVRRNLRNVYGEKIDKDGAIPAHLLGNMWAQRWATVAKTTLPFPGKSGPSAEDGFIKKNYTALGFFKESENFFTSLGLPPMVPKFWEKSILEKPDDGREIVCHASAWDFCTKDDFRIKQCTRVNMEDFVTVHHEMGHIIYDMLYKDQPIVFRGGANEGFHEAIGDVLALSVATPKHLHKLGILETLEEDSEAELNFLYTQALDKIAFLPFSYVVDQFRWDVFNGKVKPEEYNCHWWKLRFEHQGVRPPVTRKSTDFDAGSKYHVPAGVPYVRYFVSHILQYQFHKALCVAANQYDPADPAKPLHRCDIHESKEAGTLLANMLKLGSSKPWPEALEQITGQKNMDASAVLEYYKPLYDYLKAENEKHEEFIGWKETDEPLCIAA